MNVRVLCLALAYACALCNPAAVRAGESPTRASHVPVTVKVGSYFLGDDTAGGVYGVASKVSAGLEYQLRSLSYGERSRASVYFDYAAGGTSDGTNLELYSTGIAERLSIGRPTRRGVYPYLGAGIGANVNVLSSPTRATELRHTAFAQKLFVGLQRGDGIFYEVYFRAAPQSATIITSGVGLSFGYNF
jgi:hypothetical protein